MAAARPAQIARNKQTANVLECDDHHFLVRMIRRWGFGIVVAALTALASRMFTKGHFEIYGMDHSPLNDPGKMWFNMGEWKV